MKHAVTVHNLRSKLEYVASMLSHILSARRDPEKSELHEIAQLAVEIEHARKEMEE